MPLGSAGPLQAQPRVPPVHRFSGSFHEIGEQQGRALAREIRAEAAPALRQLCTAWKLTEAATLAKVVSRYEGVYREMVPNAVAEIEGIAEGARLSFPQAFFAGIRDLLPAQEGCTAVVCPGSRTASGYPLIGQTKDTTAPLERYHLFRTKEASGFRAVALAYPGWIGNLGLNSHGVSWTGNSLYGPEARGKVYPASLMKRLFYEARDLQSVLDQVRGLRFGNGCFCAADRQGTAFVMEWVAGEVDLREIRQSYGHANNILGQARARETALASNANSRLRQQRIDSLLAAQTAPATADDFERWFTDHEHHPRSICRHRNAESDEVTTSAFIADLGRRELRVALGNPCQTRFSAHRIEEI